MLEPFSTPRIIGHHVGQEPGPLVIAIGGIHGNEPAGVQALSRFFELLEEEPQINPGFVFAGEILALRGNVAALSQGLRFIDQDLNRIFDAERISQLRANQQIPFQEDNSHHEDRELLALMDAIEIAVEESQATQITILDIHTTTAHGGIFTITADDQESLQLGSELYAPVIKGMVNGVHDTTLHYFQNGRFGSDKKLTAVTFEAGQHNDPASVDLALAATINLLRALGCVQPADVRTLHDDTLKNYAKGLPNIAKLEYAHVITPADGFKMNPGYTNFQYIQEGDIVAHDKNGPVAAPMSGYMLMPLYQELGEEGFFIVTDYSLEVAF